ncbi:MAG: hypothetical protein IPL61_32460 [Myxococcales bacterium]|nr:hypothetical protein [Myxococcales bacterium]
MPIAIATGALTAGATLAALAPRARLPDACATTVELDVEVAPPPPRAPDDAAGPLCTLPAAPERPDAATTAPAVAAWPGITRLDATHYAVTRGALERALAAPQPLLRGARMIPAVSDGRPIGIKLFAVRPQSIVAALGLANGDTLRAINGVALISADNALVAYGRVRAVERIALELTRRGRPMTLHYQITE